MKPLEVMGKQTVVCGMKGAGKSNFVQHLLDAHDQYRNALVYDIAREHARLHRYTPKHRHGSEARAEAGEFVARFVTENHRDLRPDVLVIEEATRVAPNSGGVPDQLMDLIDMARHYDVGVIAVCRRLARLDTTVVELADNLLVFSSKGKNTVKRLNEEAPGAGDAAADLDPFEFLRIDGMRRWEKCKPVPEMDTTGAL
jgi:predicted kinase